MKYFIIFLILFLSCKSQKKTNASIDENTLGVAMSCEDELKDFLEKELILLRKGRRENSISIFKTTEKFPQYLKSKFQSCLIGMSKQEVFNYFGKSHIKGDEITYRVSKDSINLGNSFSLKFYLDEAANVKNVSYLGRLFSDNFYQNIKDEEFCENDFQLYLKKNLAYIDYDSQKNFVRLKRNDEFIRHLKSKYKSCLLGRTKFEILDLFGGTINFNQNKVIYDCVESKDDIKKPDRLQLIFVLNKNDKVESIKYQKRPFPID